MNYQADVKKVFPNAKCWRSVVSLRGEEAIRFKHTIQIESNYCPEKDILGESLGSVKDAWKTAFEKITI